MGDVLIKVENVSKKFSKNLRRSLVYGLQDVFTGVLGNAKKRELRKTEFWSVKDVSFEVKRGECLGLIGHNGAGKSTLLKMLNGLINPDEGTITICGKVGALIELGAGFNPILTGRENIYNNAAIIGFSKEEIDKKFDSIVEFAEIGDFLDMPVQNYSSGMKVRLGFAVAAQMEPDVLLIDEVLAVGDIGFRTKCLNRISALLNKCAVIFVSHSMQHINRICTNGLLLSHGKIFLKTENIGLLVENYYSFFEAEKEFIIGTGRAKLNYLTLSNYSKKEKDTYIFDKDEMIVDAELTVNSTIRNFAVHIIVIDIETKPIAMASTLSSNIVIKNDVEKHHITLKIPTMFSDGKYTLNFSVVEILSNNRAGGVQLSQRGMAQFIINKNTYPSGIGVQIPCDWSINQPNYIEQKND